MAKQPADVTGVAYSEVKDDAAQRLLASTGKRRDWTDVKEALEAGGKLFLPDDQMNANGAKYLSIAFARRKLGKTLHVRKVTHEGTKGRLIWLGETKAKAN